MQINKTTTKKAERGFTLIEILVVIGIIAVLAAIVLIAINPAQQFAQARSTERRSNVTAILDAVGQHIADNEGTLPPEIDGLADDTPTDVSDDDADLCTDLVDDYLPAFPTDPRTGDGDDDGTADGADITSCAGYESGYTVTKGSNGRITITAQADTDQDDDDDVDSDDVISVTR